MKKKLSRLLCALLVMTMVLAMVPAVSAADYDSYDNTNKTATVTLGNTVTISFPHSTSKHDQHIVYDKDAFTCENEKYPGKLTPKNSAVDPSETDGAKTYTIITYCNECKEKITTTVTVKYRAISSMSIDAAKTSVTIGKNGAEMPVSGVQSTARVRVKLLDSKSKGNEDYVNPKVEWYSTYPDAVDVTPDKDDSRYATLTVDSDAEAGMSTTIKATAVGDTSKTISFTVTVTDNNLTLSLDKDELSLDIDKTTSVGYTMGGPAKDKNCYVLWRLVEKSDVQAISDWSMTFEQLNIDRSTTDVAKLKGDDKGTFTTKKNGTFYLLAQAYTYNEKMWSDIQVCRVYVRDGSYSVEIVPSKTGSYNPSDENSKFYTNVTRKNELTLTAMLKSESMVHKDSVVGTWTVEDPDIAAFVNTDAEISTDTVSKVKNIDNVTLRAKGKGKTTVKVETADGSATYEVEVWEMVKLIAPDTTTYDYTNEITVSTENPLASMQSKKPTFSVEEFTSDRRIRTVSVPVEWYSREIDSKKGIVTFTGVLKIYQSEDFTEYKLGTLSGTKWTENASANNVVKVTTQISDKEKSLAIKTQPKSETYKVGKTISELKIVAEGGSSLTYQWYDGDNNKPISGATKATYKPSINKSGTYRYYCIVSSGSEYVISDTATIKVSGEYRVVFTNSSDKNVASPSTNVGSGTTYNVDVEKWDYDDGKYGSAGSCTVSWNVTKNSELGSVSSTSSSVTFTGKLAKAATKGYETMTVTASIKKSGTEVGSEEILVTVNPAEAATVKQSVGTGAVIKSSSITSAVTKAAGSGAKVSYIVFGTEKSCKLTKSSSSSSSIGDTKCYVSTSSGQKLSDVYVKTSASTASVTYTAYDADDYVLATGTVSFDTNDADDTISSSGASFKNAAAVDQIIEEYPDAEYVKFELPRQTDGKLYYEFNSISDYTSEVKDSEKYYLDAGSKDADIEDVYFLPAYGVKGKIELVYTAYSSSNSDLGEGAIALTIKSKTASSKFTDVTAKNVGSWAADSIDFCADNDLVNGKSTYSFAPSDNLTRGQLVAILYRAAGTPSVSGISNPFTDVKSSAYYYNAVLWAYKNGVVTGTSADKFSPDANVTREQIAAILYRYMGSPAATGSLTGYADRAKISSWATTAMQWAIGKGYITGIGTNLDPAGKATRAQVAVMMHRFLTK